jgi:hypothetical protein
MSELRQQMLADLRIRNYAERTRGIYVQRVAEMARHFDRSPKDVTKEEVRDYHHLPLQGLPQPTSSVPHASASGVRAPLPAPPSSETLRPLPRLPRQWKPNSTPRLLSRCARPAQALGRPRCRARRRRRDPPRPPAYRPAPVHELQAGRPPLRPGLRTTASLPAVSTCRRLKPGLSLGGPMHPSAHTAPPPTPSAPIGLGQGSRPLQASRARPSRPTCRHRPTLFLTASSSIAPTTA